MSVIGGQNPIVQDGLVYILDFGNERSYTSGSNSAQSLIYNPVTASFVAPPAGDYSGLAAAYSVRRVVSSYSGPAMEVQSGSVSASIGFDSLGNLDTASLEAFAGSGDAFVKTWYDQSGNGYHAFQAVTSSQPQIVSGGSIILDPTSSRSAVKFDGVDDWLRNTTSLNITSQTPVSIFAVNRPLSIVSYPYLFDISRQRILFYYYPSNKHTIFRGSGLSSTTSATVNTSYLYNLLYNDTNSELKVNGITFTGSVGTRDAIGPITIGGEGGTTPAGGTYYSGNISELIIYPSNQSSNRIFIENNINTYYQIYTGSDQGPTPGFDRDKLEFTNPASLSANQTFPGFSYNQGNLTLIFTGETKTNTPLFTQANQISVLGTTSSIGYGLPGNSGGRTFPASGFDHISLRFTTGSVDCFVNGIPTAPNSIFPTGSFGTGDFIASNYSGSLGNLLVYNRELTDDEIYATYLQQARRYSLPETPKPYSVDSSVYAYTQAAGITGSAVITALDAFVSGLKANNLWNKMIAIYPFLGADTTKTRYNLKDPSLNTTAITYSGSWSGSDSGSRNNNTSSYGILENIKGDYYHPLISSQSIHLSYLSYDTPASGGYLMGVEEIPGLPGDIATPAAAYSVRKVRTAYTGSAMTVRRDFDDLTFDVGFDASGNLNTGSLLTNMTASLNTPTLPGDYSGLAAAYSLRKVSSSYSGYAVEVRRSSDNVSQSIGFDSFGNFDTASLDRFIATGSGVLAGSYSGLAAAYSLRKVVPGYSGFAIQIESASVTQDIGFDSFDNLDTASIASFAGSGDAFVKIWYDQSGNNTHVTQSTSTKQPKIYSGSLGSILTKNGKPCVEFDGVDDTLQSQILTTSNQPTTRIAVATYNTTPTTAQYVMDGRGQRQAVGTNNSGNWRLYAIEPVLDGTTVPVGSTQYTLFALFSGSNTTLHVNSSIPSGMSGTTGTNGYDGVTLGAYYAGDLALFNGKIQEVLIYTSSQAANRTYIENNINSYYGIYTPSSVSTENAFVKTWYDQSGNGRHATQSVDSQQPRIVNNGVIDTINGRPSTYWSGFGSGLQQKLTGFTLNFGGANQSYTFFNVFVNGNQYGNTLYEGGFLWWYEYPPGTQNSNIPIGNLYYELGSRTALQLHTVVNSSGSSFAGSYKNSILQASASYSTNSNTISIIGNRAGHNNNWLGHIPELIIYTSDQLTNKGRIEDNINGYYNIFTHTLESGSGYVSKWYDQSGNNRHAFQPTSSRQPLILSSGSVTLDGTTPGLKWDDGKWLDNFEDYTLQSMVWVARANTSSGFKTIMNTQKSTNVNLPGTYAGFNVRADSTTYRLVGAAGATADSNDLIYSNGSQFFNGSPSSTSNNILNEHVGFLKVATTQTAANGTQIGIHYNTDRAWKGFIKELILFSTDESGNRQPIEQNTNNYFNIYYQPYNLNTNSLSLFSSPTTVAGAANNVASASFTTGGPLGLITVSRTGSSNYTLWKNRVPTKVTVGASTPQSNEIYLNAANVSNTLFSGSQNNISFASVGAGLTDDEVYTYYELVDDLQTSLNRGVQDPNAFITTWDTRITGTGTVTNTSSIALPLYGTQAITASWGDGTTSLISQSTQVDRTHSYAEPGIYTVSITGRGQGFQFNNGGDRAKLIDIGQWGSISGSTTAGFYGCTNLIGTAADPHVVQTTGLTNYFFDCGKYNGAIGNWNILSVTSMGDMFRNAITFNQNVGSWDTSNVVTTYNMFRSATSFNNGGSPSINNWNTSKMTSMNGMFNSATAFNQPVGNWDIAKVTNLSEMFSNADSFNQNIGSWNVEKVTNMSSMFYDTRDFNNSGSNSINNWRPISCSSFVNMFWGASAFNQPIGNWPLSASSIYMNAMFKATSFNQDLGSWDVSKVLSMNNMFQGSSFNNSGSDSIKNWRPISCSNFGSMFYISPNFNQPIGSWPISASSIDMSYMFAYANSFNQNIGAWNVEKVINMFNMFLGNTAFNNSGSSDINNWRPISCSNFSSMFQSATAFNQPIGNWPLSASSITMYQMFYGATNFNQNIGSWDVSKVTSMFWMLRNTNFNNSGSSDINNWRPVSCSDFERLFAGTPFNQPIGAWTLATDRNINLAAMFNGNTVFNQDITTWNTSRVTRMDSMFAGATAFNQPIGSWDTSNVTLMDAMFTNAFSFNQDIGSWNVGRVTDFNNFMSGKSSADYSYLHTIYDGWINNKLQPNRTINFSTINYSASAAEGKALLERTYNTGSITGYSVDAGNLALTCSFNHNVVAGNKIFISGSSNPQINGVQVVFATSSATMLTLTLPEPPPVITGDTLITGYGWSITDGNPV